MFAKLFLFALLSAAVAAPQGSTLSDEDTLRTITDEAAQKVRQVAQRVDRVHEEFSTMAKDRMDTLLWQAEEHKTLLHRVVKETVFKGMDKNKPLTAFTCISEKSRDAFAKIEEIKKNIMADTQERVLHGAANVTDFKLIMKEFGEYIDDFYEAKIKELKKATSATARKKIIRDVIDKMHTLQGVMESINKKVMDLKYKFFEDYIHYASGVSLSLNKAEREGADLVKKCIA